MLKHIAVLVLILTLGFGQVWGAVTYSKATSIAAGDEVVFVCETASTELTGFAGSSTKYGSGTAYTTSIAGSKVWTVETGNASGSFSFKNGSSYLYWNSGNSLYTNSTKDNKTSWKVTIDGSGNATIKNANDEKRIIMWNVSSPRFACYSGQSVGNSYYAVQIYKASSGGSSNPTGCVAPTFSPAAGTYTSTQSVALSCKTDDAKIYYTTDGTNPTNSGTRKEYTTAISVSSTQTIKAYAAKDGLDNSSVATAEYKIYPVVHAGTSADPYTVADARNAIDANTGTSNVYVTGKVSNVVGNSLPGWITYDISVDGETTSDQFRVYKGKSTSGNNFTSADDIQVGDVVVVYGSITYYSIESLYEFSSNSQLISLSRVVTVALYNGANGATKVGDFVSGTNALPTTAADVAGWTFDGNWSKDLFASKTNSQAYASGTYFAGGAEEYSGTNLYAIYRRTPTGGSAIYSTQPTPGYPLSLDPATGDLRITANKDLAFIPVGESVTLSAVGGLVTTWTVYDSDLNDITSSFTYTSSSSTSFVFDMPAQEILVEATMCALPAVPSGLSTSLHDGGTRGKTVFSWTAGSGATKYTLTYTKAGSDPVVVSDIANTTYTVNPLAVGEYTWSVKSVNDCGESAAVNGEGFTICPDFAAITPTVGETSSIAQTTATANWTAVADAAKYTVQIFNGETKAVEYENVNATSKAITGLTANTTYVVKVTAYNACNEASLVGSSVAFTTLKNVYAVSFNANGGTGEIAAVNVTDGEATTLPSSGFTKAGFSLSGWKVNNEGALLEKGASYTVTGAATLYAQWSPNTINVTYKPNGPTADEVEESFTYGEEYNAKAANTFSREGYQFKHWNNAADGSGAVTLAAGAAYTGTEDIILYAIWDQLYTVSWVVNGTTKTTQTAIAGTALTTPYSPVVSDCDNSKAFVGWIETQHYTDATDAPSDLFEYANTLTMPVGGATYYAVFADVEPGTEDVHAQTTFSSKSWETVTEGDATWTSGQAGNQLSTGRGVQVTTGVSGANATTVHSYDAVSSVVITYSTNASNSEGSIAIMVGTTDYTTTNNVTVTGGTTDRTTTFIPSGDAASGAVKMTVTCTYNSVYVKSVRINYTEDATVRTNYTTDCNTVLPVCEEPTFDVEEGTYTIVKNVTITTETEGATIYYTTDGSNPATSETKQIYSSAVRVDHTLTLKAVAVKEDYINSTVKSATYTINLPQCATPTFSVEAGRYTETQSVVLSCETEGADIYYTTDGETPTTESTKYTEAISVATNMTIKAVAIAENTTLSEVASATYKIVGPGSTLWELVESTNDLNDGDIIVIASNTEGKTTNNVLELKNSAKFFGEEDATFSEDANKSELIELDENAQQFILGKSGNYWTLSNENDEYLKETSVKNLDWSTTTFTWDISIDETTHAATISNSSVTSNKIIHNVGSSRFTTYSSDPTASMLLPQIYRKTVICVDPDDELAFASSVPAAINNTQKAQLATTGGNGEDVVYTVISANAANATISNDNKFSATAAGTYTVQAKQEMSADYKCAQVVTMDITITVLVSSVELNKEVLTLEVGQFETLIATVLPADAANKNVTWSVTEGNAFVEVDQNGKVTGEAIGSGVVQVKTEDGEFTATCAVTVTPPTPVLTLTATNPLAFDNVEPNLTKDLTVNLKGSYLVANATYSIEGDNVFTVETELDNDIIGSEDGQTLTIRFAPTEEGDKSATITFSSGVASQTLTVTGTGKNRYTATLHAGNGSVTSETIQESSIGSGITLPEATLSQTLQDGGWSFVGWSETELINETAEVPTTIDAGEYAIAADKEFYAVYTRTNVVDGSASCAVTPVTSATDMEENKPVTWKCSDSNTYGNPLRLYANQTITFAGKQGTTTTIKSVTFTMNQGSATSLQVNSTNLTGNTWTGDAEEVTFKNSSSSQVRISSVSVTYQTSQGLFTTYPAELFAIEFDLNGGEGNFSEQTVTKGSSYTLDGSEPTKQYFTFDGWSDGVNTYAADATISNVQNDITLTAQWIEVSKADVIFKNGETTVQTIANKHQGESYDLIAAPAAEEGTQFIGWRNESTGAVYDASTTDFVMGTPAADSVYVAQWLIITPEPTASVIETADLSNGEWILVTNENQIHTGDVVIIAAKNADYALGLQHIDNAKCWRTQTAITKEDNKISNPSDNVAKLFVQNGYDNGQFGLYDMNTANKGYLLDVTGGNYLGTQSGIVRAGSWIITIENGEADIQSAESNKYIMYNGTYDRFSCYNNGQSAIALYKWVKKITSDMNVSDVTLTDAVIVTDGKTLTVDEDATLDNLTVENGGKVQIAENKQLDVQDFYIGGTHGKSGQVMNAENLHVDGEAYFDFTLGVDVSTPEGAAKAEAQWHNFSVPFPVSATSGVYGWKEGEWKKLTNEVDYAIEDYHGELRKNGEYGWKKFRSIMTPGHTYSMTVNGDIQTYRFKKAGDYTFDADPTVGFSQHAAAEDKNAGWNGLGNMRLCYSSINNTNIAETTPEGQSTGRYVLVLNAEDYRYDAYLLSKINLTVGSAFFIQASADGTMGFNEAQATVDKVYAPARTQAKIAEPIMVTMSGERGTDHMYISADEDATSTYQIGRDMQRMFATSNPTTPLIYTMNYGGLKLAAEDAPMVYNQAVYTLQLYAPIAGEYTLQTEAVTDADVYLTYEGAIIWNISESEYTVDLSKGKNNGYGLKLVKKAPSVVTGIDQIDAKAGAQKVIIDEHVYILRGGQMYDVNGKMVK